MKISIEEICKFATTAPSNRSFRGGENLINSGHLIKCSRIAEIDSNSDFHEILAFCLQTSGIRNNPHEITGKIKKNGQVMEMECSCRSGLGQSCKHVVAALLYCNRIDMEDLKQITCTDKKCVWSGPQKKALEMYDGQPLENHECFKLKRDAVQRMQKRKRKRDSSTSAVDEDEDRDDIFRKIMIENHPASALALHIQSNEKFH